MGFQGRCVARAGGVSLGKSSPAGGSTERSSDQLQMKTAMRMVTTTWPLGGRGSNLARPREVCPPTGLLPATQGGSARAPGTRQQKARLPPLRPVSSGKERPAPLGEGCAGRGRGKPRWGQCKGEGKREQAKGDSGQRGDGQMPRTHAHTHRDVQTADTALESDLGF